MQQKYELVQYLGRGTFGEVYVVSADSGDTLTNVSQIHFSFCSSNHASETMAASRSF